MIDTTFQRVQLTPAEVAFALAIATQRDACKKPELRDFRRSKTHTGFGVNFAGLIGEMCVRRIYGGKIDQTIRPAGDNHAADLRMADGKRVEVKTTLFSGDAADLKFEPGEVDRFDYCCFVKVVLPDLGYVYPIWSSEELKPLFEMKNYGNGEMYIFNPFRYAMEFAKA
jgi:hypothetical protein